MPRKPTANFEAAESETTGAGVLTEDPAPPTPDLIPPDDDEDEGDDEEEQDAPSPSSAEAAGLDVAGLIDQFATLMAQREQQIWERLEERLAMITPPAVNHLAKETSAELAAPPGQNPTWYTMPNLEMPASTPSPPRQRRMVAFIPKTDPYNPKLTTFKTWINGREIRAKRGQVMILESGHGINLARKGHGNCVDVAAMQGSLGEAAAMQIRENPDYAMPSDWNGMPLTNKSSIPIGR